ncbi:MAG: alanine--tRNA ligase [Oscillospiraceae bacterium]|nr:alanine--tRNA ligase [Oscillospiraceae bacterium]
MKKYGLNELREMFLSFFETKDHLRLPSFSLIPQNDASLLLINSGMAPMKPWFTGEQEPPRRRVCTCQKCIRTGDIENIGKTARHGTYFEMLGNFSFGDYFKKEAIAWSWEFLTSPEWVGLDPDRLYPSVYQDDDEAWEIWNKDIGIPPERIFRFGKADNFWEHGSGPCGPCSEIYYDRGEQWGCGKPDCTVGCDCDRYIEVWNNVFSQFDNDGNNNYTELAQKNIDTGMGLERLACVCQEVASLFDVDTVMNITNKVSEITNAHYGETKEKDVSLRVITDHIRSATFMICDGVQPSNEGRGYVLRRLLRRAARHGKLLGVNEPFLYQVCDTVIHENEGHYPELRARQDYITKVIRVEEENFAKTIDGGLKIFNDMLAEHQNRGEKTFSGADAFKLYDTYGFPIDLTIEMVQEQGMELDEDGFKALMEEQRVRARKAREALGDLGWAGVEFGKEVPETEFVGYDNASIDGAKVVALVVENELVEEMMPGIDGIVVLDKTPMYAEMGGQVADHGVIYIGSSEADFDQVLLGEVETQARFVVNDVQKNKGGKYMHYGKLTGGALKVGDTVSADIDTDRRGAIARAHSATHLLHKALQNVLGDHVHQAGSYVDPDFLRFDFTHCSAMTAEELAEAEKIVNEYALDGMSIVTEEMSIDAAREKGATALFGEKYGDVVRVVDMGGCSVELCGGTHLANTAMVGSFRIDSEFSVASGVRRIEAIVGRKSLQEMDRQRQTLFQAAEALKTKPAEVVQKAQASMEEMRALRNMVEKFKAKEAAGETDRILFGAHEVGGLKVLTASVPDADANKLRQMGDMFREKESAIVAVLATVAGDKITFLAVCGKDAVARGIKAGDIIKKVSAVAGGSGGGKPDSAMGGGKDVLKLDDALACVDDFVAEKIS